MTRVLGPVNQGAAKAGKCPHGAGSENPEQSTNNAPQRERIISKMTPSTDILSYKILSLSLVSISS